MILIARELRAEDPAPQRPEPAAPSRKRASLRGKHFRQILCATRGRGSAAFHLAAGNARFRRACRLITCTGGAAYFPHTGSPFRFVIGHVILGGVMSDLS